MKILTTAKLNKLFVNKFLNNNLIKWKQKIKQNNNRISIIYNRHNRILKLNYNQMLNQIKIYKMTVMNKNSRNINVIHLIINIKLMI